MYKIISINDIKGGGAGQIASTLSKYCKSGKSGHYMYYDTLYNQQERFLNNVWREFLGLEFYLRDSILVNQIIKNYDLVHLHNLHGMRWSPKLIKQISKTKPVVWTLHDLWIITGKCPYPYDCDLYKTLQCERSVCKYKNHYPYYRRLQSGVKEKYKIFNNINNLTCVSPSKWLADCVSDVYPDLDVRVIPNGINLYLYYRRDKHITFNNSKKTILSILSDGSDSFRKGTDIIKRFYREYREDYNWITFGTGYLPGALNFGYVDNSVKPFLFSSSDVYLHCAREDNYPTTVLEAMACDCNVVATGVGGMKEMGCCMTEIPYIKTAIDNLVPCNVDKYKIDAITMCDSYMKLYEEIYNAV